MVVDCVTSSLNRSSSRKIKFHPSQLRNHDLQQKLELSHKNTIQSLCGPTSPLLGAVSHLLVALLLLLLVLIPLYYVLLVLENIL